MFSGDDLLLTRQSKDLFILKKQGVCDACGGVGPFKYESTINNTLSEQWCLNDNQKKMMSARESMRCYHCGCSYRLRLLSRAINYFVAGSGDKSLLQNIEDGLFKNRLVAEINSCGVLHEVLKEIPKLHYSEYGSTNSSVPHEDLQALSYDNATIDIILTSDVLEHIPDVKLALEETYRVLKPGGAHIMTIPVIMDRKTRRRAYIDKNKIINDLEPSFHGSGEPDYLVWNEFGYDFLDMLKEVGYVAHYLFVNNQDINDLSGVVLAIKPNEKGDYVKFNKLDSLYDDSDVLWQSRYIGRLINKIELTNNHVANLENIIKIYESKYGRLSD